jgi:hypothetical protein
MIKTATVGQGGTSEGAANEKKGVRNSNILSLKIFSQIGLRILPSAGNLTPVKADGWRIWLFFLVKGGPD